MTESPVALSLAVLLVGSDGDVDVSDGEADANGVAAKVVDESVCSDRDATD